MFVEIHKWIKILYINKSNNYEKQGQNLYHMIIRLTIYILENLYCMILRLTIKL